MGGDLNVLLKALLAKNEGKSGVGSRVISMVCRVQEPILTVSRGDGLTVQEPGTAREPSGGQSTGTEIGQIVQRLLPHDPGVPLDQCCKPAVGRVE